MCTTRRHELVEGGSGSVKFRRGCRGDGKWVSIDCWKILLPQNKMLWLSWKIPPCSLKEVFRWWQLTYFLENFTPDTWGKWSNLTFAYFSDGWFNHQLDEIFTLFEEYTWHVWRIFGFLPVAHQRLGEDMTYSLIVIPNIPTYFRKSTWSPDSDHGALFFQTRCPVEKEKWQLEHHRCYQLI